MRLSHHTLLAAALASAVFSSVAHAVAVLAVDLNVGGSATTSASFTDPEGSSIAFTSWNIPIGTFSAQTKSFTGLSTDYTASGSITVSFSRGFGSLNDRGPSSVTGSTDYSSNFGGSGTTYFDLYRDNVAGPAGTTVITFSGLKASTVYGIYFQAAEPAAARSATFTPTTPGVTNPVGQTTSTGVNFNANSLTDAAGSVTFTALTSSSTGTLTFDWAGAQGPRLNGFQIFAPIPEPASFGAFAGLTAAGSLMVRRRRRAAS